MSSTNKPTKQVREAKKLLRREGFEIIDYAMRKSGHGRLWVEKDGVNFHVDISLSPSDVNAVKNVVRRTKHRLDQMKGLRP